MLAWPSCSGFTMSCVSSLAILSRPLPLEHTGDDLMAAVIGVRFLTIEPESLEHRGILDGKQDRGFASFVRVLMPGPRRDHEKIPLAPVEALPRDHARALACKDMVDGAARLAVGLGPDAGPDQLDPESHGGRGVPACGRIGILHRHIIERA